MVVERILVDMVNLEWVDVACCHGIDNAVRLVLLAVNIDDVSRVTLSRIDHLPARYSVFWTAMSVDCVAEPRRARGVNVEQLEAAI